MGHVDRDIVLSRAAVVELLVLDVDGVLTDGSIVYTSGGEQILSFHVHDGLGIKLLQQQGVRVAIISSRLGPALEKRAEELGINLFYQGIHDKMACFQDILNDLSIPAEKAAAVGDDLVDLPVLRSAGLSVTVSNAASGMSDYVDYVTSKPGGSGAVREVCELILMAKQQWAGCVDKYLSF